MRKILRIEVTLGCDIIDIKILGSLNTGTYLVLLSAVAALQKPGTIQELGTSMGVKRVFDRDASLSSEIFCSRHGDQGRTKTRFC